MARNQESGEANAKFLQFVRYQFLLRLAKALPNTILRHDQKWPGAPKSCAEVSFSQDLLTKRLIVYHGY